MKTWHGEFDEAPVAVAILLVPATGFADFHLTCGTKARVQSAITSRLAIDIQVIEVGITYFQIFSLSFNIFGGPVAVRIGLLQTEIHFAYMMPNSKAPIRIGVSSMTCSLGVWPGKGFSGS